MRPAPRSPAPVVVAGLVGLLGLLGLLAASVACIIPDAGVDVDDAFDNVGAVRIVEPSPVTPRADDSCSERHQFPCPRLDTIPTGLLRPDFPLCVCPAGFRDLGVGDFDIFVEDPDVDEEGSARDDILGALFVDIPADATRPDDYLAYASLLPTDEPAPLFRAADPQTIERPDPHLKAWSLVGQPRIDLCNDNDGLPLTPGVHEIRLIVTDRPWYRPVLRDAEGMVVEDQGEPVFGDPVIGMPDLAAGATYDARSYVIQCHDGNDPPEGIQCNCEA